MKKRSTSVPSVTEKTQSPEDLQQEICRRAYELYEQRGGEHGRDLEDWLAAENEVTNSRSQRDARQS